MPVIRNGNDDGIDFFVVEQLLVAAGRFYRLANDFLSQFVTPIVQVTSGRAFYSRELDRIGQQPGAFHADSDNSVSKPVVRACVMAERWNRFGFEYGDAADQRSPCESGCPLQKSTACKTRFFHIAISSTQNFVQLLIRK